MAMTAIPPALELRDVTVAFGGLVAVDGVSFAVHPGVIHSLIGPNGAGKSTALNAITGLVRISRGSIRLSGQEIGGLGPHKVAARGVARTFQNTELFRGMTALDNVVIGAHRDTDYGFAAAVARTPRFRRSESATIAFAESILADVGLADDRHVAADSLPFGKQRRLEIARALAARPRVMLLDEPAAGLRAAELEQLNALLAKLRDERGMTILLIDHVMQVVMNISDMVTVLNFGRKIAEGSPDSVRRDPEVRRAYLGSALAHAATG